MFYTNLFEDLHLNFLFLIISGVGWNVVSLSAQLKESGYSKSIYPHIGYQLNALIA